MTKSLRTDPRRIRADRRASFPAVRMRRATSGRYHPASAADVRQVLTVLGPQVYYGLEVIELASSPPAGQRLLLGRLAAPGKITLYDQPRSPWRLGFPLSPEERDNLRDAGAVVEEPGVVSWPGDTLRLFMLRHVLVHELGHHMLQHERRLRGERAARTRDHESRAEVIAKRLRELLS